MAALDLVPMIVLLHETTVRLYASDIVVLGMFCLIVLGMLERRRNRQQQADAFSWLFYERLLHVPLLAVLLRRCPNQVFMPKVTSFR